MKKAFLSLFLALSLLSMPILSVRAIDESAVSAPSAVLMEPTTGKILFDFYCHEKRPCASITKVMTLLLVFEALDSGRLSLDDTVTASAHAASMGGSDIWLEEGESMSADDMIKATVVASANDAAVALAEHLSGSEDAFVEQMNKRAKELGMADTVFKNCNGLDEEGHITSAYDVALMSRELMQYPKIYDYTSVWLDYLRGGETQIVNTNKLLKTYNGITGLKTGTTDDAGCCMAASACRDGMQMLSVVLGCDTGKQRFADSAALLDYGFANYAIKELKLPEDFPDAVAVTNGMTDSVPISCTVDSQMLMDRSSADEPSCAVDLPESVEAPIEEGEVIGSVTYTLGDEQKRFDVIAGGAAEKTSFGLIFAELFHSLIAL